MLESDEFTEKVLSEIEISQPYFSKSQDRLPTINTIAQ